jgi:hypothetical protein
MSLKVSPTISNTAVFFGLPSKVFRSGAEQQPGDNIAKGD